jgi:hypothetical protein
LQLWGNQERSSADVKALTLTHIKELEEKIAALKEMRDTPRHLVDERDGDHRADCPIIGSLEGTVPLPDSQHQHRHKPAENLGHVHWCERSLGRCRRLARTGPVGRTLQRVATGASAWRHRADMKPHTG